jgi:hypothetical protein
MKAKDIRELLHADPFRPFIIRSADGACLLVQYEDFVAMSPSGRTMSVYRHDKPDDYQIVNVVMVTRLETPARNGASKPRK